MARLKLVRRRPCLLPPNEPNPPCKVCGHEMDRVVCWQCGGEGVYGHDCGEDACCCLYPEDNKRCGICNGAGAWWECPNAEWESLDEGALANGPTTPDDRRDP